ncbi:MAG: 50S ribosomal protein L3 [Candidatus Eisenbacteria bacterium]|nr:50S ribosomal protein L3 [Candidatus Eisenbacteria bacterium]
MPGLIGKKVGMTQLFDETGRFVPISVIQAGPCPVVQTKTKDRDGYEAIQVGFEDVKEKRANKPNAGHFKKAGVSPKRILREFRVTDAKQHQVGSVNTVEMFEVGSVVNVTGTSKGKGFQGVIKRHKFHGGDDTHGCTTHRLPGSIGASAYPSRPWKGQKLPGRMGGARVTVRNLTVVGVDKERHLLLVRGAVPGGPNGYLEVKMVSKAPLKKAHEAPAEQKKAPAKKK